MTSPMTSSPSRSAPAILPYPQELFHDHVATSWTREKPGSGRPVSPHGDIQFVSTEGVVRRKGLRPSARARDGYFAFFLKRTRGVMGWNEAENTWPCSLTAT
ncbi:Gamma-glutamylcyclotransferase-like protein [Corchorus olitorius]|uniref:Gamma-glutamylcyclotransferase-like protein n=1 Tax=Corchorus olitorius TaxID=93759 RepID=A0A1R3H528_9ROSI|nr:Gamma-glutamylcyclotransferase-like protein [Corchorus olitorius]